MRNPNETTTTIRTTTIGTTIEFAYTSASVAQYDFESVRKAYQPSQVTINGKIITVIVEV